MDQENRQEQQIRERAYYLWQAAGSPAGGAEAFWQRALEEHEAAEAEQNLVDREAEDSFPASDPPSFTGITGTGAANPKRRKK